MFSFPITETQILEYLKENKRSLFKVVVIGQAEISLKDNYNARLCRMLIKNSKYRGNEYRNATYQWATKNFISGAKSGTS